MSVDNLDHVLNGPREEARPVHLEEHIDAPPEDDEAVVEATPPRSDDTGDDQPGS